MSFQALAGNCIFVSSIVQLLNCHIMKEEIKNWFQSDRKFETGRSLFFKYSNNLSFKTVLNRQGNNPGNYSRMCYELAKLAGIPEMVYKRILSVPISREVIEVKPDQVDINSLDPKVILDNIELYNLAGLKWFNLQRLYRASSHKGARTKEEILSALTGMKHSKLNQVVPEEVKRAFRLRQEFPFLSTRECPDTLKILVNDMLSAHEQYMDGHGKLVEAMDPAAIEALSGSVVENYLENRQIWQELNHYKEKGTILGKHPIFDWIKRKETISRMPVPELVKLKDQLENNIPRTIKKINDEPEHPKTGERQQRVEQFKLELSEVKRLLNING